MKKFTAFVLSIVLSISIPFTMSCVGTAASVTDTVKTEDIREFNGHYYEVFNNATDYATATFNCDLFGGHLVTITSQAEQDFVFSLVGTSDTWLGGELKNGKWTWVTGENFSAYQNWIPGQPSDPEDEQYLGIWEGKGQWNDYRASSSNIYVCEWENNTSINNPSKASVYGAAKYNGHYYKYYPVSTNWNQAKAYCEKLGGYLVTVTSKAENDMVYGLTGKNNAWIGLSDSVKEGYFRWVTWERTDYMNWAPKQPDNDFNGTEDYCGFMDTNKWNDFVVNTDGVKGFVCEWNGTNPIILTSVYSSTIIKATKTAYLKYQIYPVNTKLSFVSSNSKIVSVSSTGKITAKKAGKAIITIIASDKKTKVSISVTVIK
ncbi:MAG TPA: lectin-like protein [Clostridia bacterium]|nr:lectin-like protein [Clostridia bacterium]